MSGDQLQVRFKAGCHLFKTDGLGVLGAGIGETLVDEHGQCAAAVLLRLQHRFVERQCRGVVGVEAGRRIELEAAGSELSAAVHLRERFGEERVHAGEGEDAATLVARGLCHHPVIELR